MTGAEGEQLSFATPEPEPEPEQGGTPLSAATAPMAPTAEQAAAIDARQRDIFLEAGAGTGKTRVLVDRYCDAIDLDQIEPGEILAFTFTEKAAAEMRRRVRVELMRRAREAGGSERGIRLLAAARAGESAPITTIHGFCRRLIAAHPVAAGLDPRFRVLDADEAGRLAALAFEGALEDCALDDDDVALIAAGYRHQLPGLVRGAHSDLRNHGQRRPQLPALQITSFDGDDEEPDDEQELAAAAAGYEALSRLLTAFSDRYEEVKAERSGVDFDDLQLIALELLEGNKQIGAAYRERYAHLLVDEFQDTSPLQVGLIRALQGPETRLFTVGDEFQSIYAFPGADLESFREQRRRLIERDGADAVLPLGGSFRSTPEVVAAVNAVGRCLLVDFHDLRVGRLPEAGLTAAATPAVELLLTEREGWKEDGVELLTAAVETEPNRIAEARHVARRLAELAEQGVPRGSMVLLLRAFSHVDAYAEALELAGLEPYVVGGRGYWSSQQVEDALRLLTCVANPLEDEALFGALASPACGASPDALWILRAAAGRRRHIWPTLSRGLVPIEAQSSAALEETDEDPEREERRRAAAEWLERLPAGDRERIGRFAQRLIELREVSATLALDALVERVLESFDYDLAALTLPNGRRRAANLLKLIRLAGEYEAHEGRDLRGFLAYAGERAARSDREAEATIAADDHDGITVMTVHAAKGLEFDCVAVADLGRGMTNPGAPPALRLDFNPAGSGERVEPEDPGPRIGLRLSRAGAAPLSVEGYKSLNDAAAAADSEEAGRLAYVAASRARRHLLLSGLFDPRDIEGGPADLQPRHSVLARLLPALGVDGSQGQIVSLPAPSAREDLEAEFEPARAAVRVNRAGPQAAAELAFDLRDAGASTGEAPGGRPPLLALSERSGSAARNLSYAALADYNRCGYRFLIERVLGLEGDDDVLAAVGARDGSPDPPEPAPEGAAESTASPPARDAALGFGRAVHELLEGSARAGWSAPTAAEVGATLLREGGAVEAVPRAIELTEAWLGSPLLAELVAAGVSFRPEVPFRVELTGGTVLRGTIDLLCELPGEPPLVLDFKTDAQTPGAGAELSPGYTIQRSLYAHAISAATGSDRVASAYVFLADVHNPVRTVLDRGEIDAGTERIEAIVGRIRAREFKPSPEPHAALCHDCPARARLCPHPPELTLATRPGAA